MHGSAHSSSLSFTTGQNKTEKSTALWGTLETTERFPRRDEWGDADAAFGAIPITAGELQPAISLNWLTPRRCSGYQESGQVSPATHRLLILPENTSELLAWRRFRPDEGQVPSYTLKAVEETHHAHSEKLHHRHRARKVPGHQPSRRQSR